MAEIFESRAIGRGRTSEEAARGVVQQFRFVGDHTFEIDAVLRKTIVRRRIGARTSLASCLKNLVKTSRN